VIKDLAPVSTLARRWDHLEFAMRIRLRLVDYPNLRAAAAEAGVSPTTLSRAANGWPELSHENFVRLETWMEGSDQ
jgi:hypothetical protein